MPVPICRSRCLRLASSDHTSNGGEHRKAPTKPRRSAFAVVGGHIRGNLIAYVALFFALGGTAAAATIVTSESQIATGAVASRAILDHSVQTVDLGAAEAWHVVGAAGQPVWTLTPGCVTGYACEFKYLSGGSTEFYKDPYGQVHIRVNACYGARFPGTPVGSGTCFGAFTLSNTVGRKFSPCRPATAQPRTSTSPCPSTTAQNSVEQAADRVRRLGDHVRVQ